MILNYAFVSVACSAHQAERDTTSQSVDDIVSSPHPEKSLANYAVLPRRSFAVPPPAYASLFQMIATPGDFFLRHKTCAKGCKCTSPFDHRMTSLMSSQ